jgi:hypothetical protein
MDAVTLKLLEAEIKDQLDKIEQVYFELEDRASSMRPDSPALIESVAYQLHNLYTAVEDLLKIVANAFENNVADLSRWHSQLLHRMSLTIAGIRPALLSTESAELLNELRAFRHFFRHAYGRPLNFNRVTENLKFAQHLRPLLHRDATQFLYSLGLSTGEEEA